MSIRAKSPVRYADGYSCVLGRNPVGAQPSGLFTGAPGPGTAYAAYACGGGSNGPVGLSGNGVPVLLSDLTADRRIAMTAHFPSAARIDPEKASPIARMTCALVGRETIVVTSATVTIAPSTLNILSPNVVASLRVRLDIVNLGVDAFDSAECDYCRYGSRDDAEERNE